MVRELPTIAEYRIHWALIPRPILSQSSASCAACRRYIETDELPVQIPGAPGAYHERCLKCCQCGQKLQLGKPFFGEGTFVVALQPDFLCPAWFFRVCRSTLREGGGTRLNPISSRCILFFSFFFAGDKLRCDT